MGQATLSTRAHTIVFRTLLLLLAVSAWLARYPLGVWHTPAALGISAAKTVLIVLFFMHVIHSSRLTQLFVVGGLLWLSIALLLTFSDYATRGWNTGELPAYRPTAIDRVSRPAAAKPRSPATGDTSPARSGASGDDAPAGAVEP